MGLLERLQPLSQDYLDKLEHIRSAVAHHMYEEEGNWFLDIRTKLPLSEQDRLTARYSEEFSRYMGGPADIASVSGPSFGRGRPGSVGRGAQGQAV